MDSKQIINYRQMAWLTASLLTGGGIVSIQHDLVRIARMDAWFTYILPTLYVALIAYAFYKLTQRFPGRNIFEINKIVMGKAFGVLFNLILIFHFWLMLIRDVRSFCKFMGTILLPNTPEEIVLLVLVLLVMYFGRTSIEVIARVNDIFFPCFALTILCLPLFLSNELDKSLVEPILAGDTINVLYGNMLSLGWYGDIFIAGAFLHTISQIKQVRSALRHGAILSSMFLGIFLLMEVLVFGPGITENLIYPNYNLVQQIHITDFLDRMDLPILSIWAPTLFCKDILIYLALLTGIASFVKQRDYSTLNTPVGFFVLLTSMLAFKNTTEVFSFGNYSSSVIIAYQPIMLLLLLGLARRFPLPKAAQSGPSGQPSPDNQGQGGTDPPEKADDHKQSDPAPQQSNRSRSASNGAHGPKYHLWSRLSNILLFVSLISVGLGLWGSEYHATIGIGCGIVYGLAMILAVITSYLELVQARQQRT